MVAHYPKCTVRFDINSIVTCGVKFGRNCKCTLVLAGNFNERAPPSDGQLSLLAKVKNILWILKILSNEN
jgi:hypothetical protein